MVLARASLLWSALAHAGLLVTFACLVGAQPAKRRAAPPLVRCEEFASMAAPEPRPLTPAVVDVQREEAPIDAAVDWPDAERRDERELVEPEAATVVREPRRLAAAAMQRRVVAVPTTPSTEPDPVAVAEPAPTPAASAARTRTLVPIPGTDRPPTYPPLARRRGWEGTVLLGIDCDADGAVQSVRVLRSSGHAVLDEAAAAAVRQWRFAAGPGHCEQSITFRLKRTA